MQVVPLENLFFGGFFNRVKDLEHGIADKVTDFNHGIEHKAGNVVDVIKNDIDNINVGWAAGQAWQGASWCDMNAECTAEVQKYGSAAVQFATNEKASAEAKSAKLHMFLNGLAASAKADIEHDLIAAVPDVKWASGKAWQGATWCDQNAACKAEALKYGTVAVQAALKKGTVIIANLPSKDDIKKHIATDVMTAEQKAKMALIAGKGVIVAGVPKVEWAAGQLWKGANWCDQNTACKTEVMKYGQEAVKLALERHAMTNSLQNLYGSSHSYLQNLSPAYLRIVAPSQQCFGICCGYLQAHPNGHNCDLGLIQMI